jgi:hypothetical protein
LQRGSSLASGVVQRADVSVVGWYPVDVALPELQLTVKSRTKSKSKGLARTVGGF